MYKLIHNDCLEEVKKLDNNSIDCIITDPPYGIDQMNVTWDSRRIKASMDMSKNSCIGSLPVGMKFNPQDAKDLQVFLNVLAGDLIEKIKPGVFCIAFSQPRSSHRVALAFEDAGFEVRDQLVWRYGAGQGKAQGMQNFVKKAKYIPEEEKDAWISKMSGLKTPQLTPCFETMWLFQKPKEGTFVQNYTKFGVGLVDYNHKKWRVEFEHKKPSKEERKSGASHPTQKPVSLIEELILAFCPNDGLVLDCFMGSGTTAIACKRTGRRFIGFEKDQEYFLKAQTRINKEGHE